MANHASAKKRAKQNPKRAKINAARKSRIKTFIKKIEAAVNAGDADAAAAAFKAAQPEIMRGVSKGVMHKKTAARKISRLSAKLKSSKTPAAQKAT
ncbi:MAG: 30S ribosomal protein S20 [Micavibrio aeruginosavorus]|uniref:Small ribosomal subunit protein bS20 n=1 Tax=Micavibrio aeruginosavorus TaxID=349221 RepID=A0A2W5FQW9_9BACT|nr:MAG: 30S ribosomal protein S20 [Micavibrio aeruginosavorus]